MAQKQSTRRCGRNHQPGQPRLLGVRGPQVLQPLGVLGSVGGREVREGPGKAKTHLPRSRRAWCRSVHYASHTVDDLPPGIKPFNNCESFPNLSYPIYDRNGDTKHAGLFPPAELERKLGTYMFGVINTIAMPLATDGLVQ